MVENNPDRFLKENRKIFDTWFECCLTVHVPPLIGQPKWYKSDRDTQVGDIVLMLKHEGSFSSQYQYGMIHKVIKNADSKIRKVIVRYRNNNETTDRFTTRSTRSLVMIHRVDELNILQQLGTIASKVDSRFTCRWN